MKAKKSLGQNFLKSEPALREIIKAGEIKKDDLVLEIGPGKGALTKKLLENSGLVVAVEKDNQLFEMLQEKFAKEIEDEKLILLNEDILEFEVEKMLLSFAHGLAGGGTQETEDLSKISKAFSPQKKSRTYKIIANIPYNITGAILKKFLTAENQPEKMVLMVQHEVAKRIVASDKKESILSISVKAYGEPKLVMKVPARYFSPAPKVDSAVISINNISREKFNILPPPPLAPPPFQGGGRNEVQIKNLNSLAFEQRFWEIVKNGFAHKRKKLSGNLKNIKFTDSSPAKNIFEKLKDKRAEDLTLLDWISLAK